MKIIKIPQSTAPAMFETLKAVESWLTENYVDHTRDDDSPECCILCRVRATLAEVQAVPVVRVCRQCGENFIQTNPQFNTCADCRNEH